MEFLNEVRFLIRVHAIAKSSLPAHCHERRHAFVVVGDSVLRVFQQRAALVRARVFNEVEELLVVPRVISIRTVTAVISACMSVYSPVCRVVYPVASEWVAA